MQMHTACARRCVQVCACMCAHMHVQMCLHTRVGVCICAQVCVRVHGCACRFPLSLSVCRCVSGEMGFLV